MIPTLFFVFFVGLFIYSYLLYPSSLHYLPDKELRAKYSQPRLIIVLIAAYNEEQHIEQTIESVFRSSISDRIEKLIIADDDSTDNTLRILKKLQGIHSDLFVEKVNRIGKPQALNFLIDKYLLNTNAYHVVMMDANISLDKNCIEELEKEIVRENMGMVGASVLPYLKDQNVESQYIQRENRIKREESRTMGYTIGVFGACYMIKGELYRTIPKNFITDDLFLTFSVIRQKHYVLYSSSAHVHEHITSHVANEFRRKSRYAAGNFQILFHFTDLLNPWKTSSGFVYAYFFHKIIRWISPLIFLLAWLLSFFQFFGEYSNILIYAGSLVCLFLCLNYILTVFKIKPVSFRIYYFLSMNLAILYGFFNYLKGIKSNVWERSERT